MGHITRNFKCGTSLGMAGSRDLDDVIGTRFSLPVFHLYFLCVVIKLGLHFFFFFFFFAFSRATPATYGGSQAKGLIGGVATGLRQSHGNAGSKLRLRPTPQLTATPDP